MSKFGSDVYSIVVGLLCFVAFILLFVMLRGGLQLPDSAIKLPLLVITGVMALFATLALVAVTFSVAGLSDPSQALGLPEGSVRAAIALSLIVIFAITSIFLYSSLASPTGVANQAAGDFAKQVFAVVGTLMTSVTSFYFATRAGTSTAKTPTSTPTLARVMPTDATRTTAPFVVALKIFGTDLQLAKTVKLEMSGGVRLATDLSVTSQSIRASLLVSTMWS